MDYFLNRFNTFQTEFKIEDLKESNGSIGCNITDNIFFISKLNDKNEIEKMKFICNSTDKEVLEKYSAYMVKTILVIYENISTEEASNKLNEIITDMKVKKINNYKTYIGKENGNIAFFIEKI